MRAFFRTAKIISIITLFFFSWAYLPMYQIAVYAAEEKQNTVASRQKTGEGKKPKKQRTEEKFEKTLEKIREKIEKAEKKALKNQDITTEVAEVKAERSEIESLDVELRKEFAATEKKLKDAKLPKKILDRHYKFVKHYEDNLKELKANIDGIEKAKTKAGKKLKIRKAKAHLEKTKPPKRHTPLDPNKLPHRLRKVKKAKKPRTKKEEFERDFPPQKNKGTKKALTTDERRFTQIKSNAIGRKDTKALRKTSSLRDFVADSVFSRELTQIDANDSINGTQINAERTDYSSVWNRAAQRKPILVASAGSLAGLMDRGNHVAVHGPQLDFPFSATSAVNDFTLNSELSTQNYLLAQATPAPTADDLSETPEVQFTQEIQDLAAQLGHNPVKIYEWVRNNIEYVPTYGSIQGAQMTLETKMGNAFDTASLLISLLRVSGIHAKYVYGTVDIPVEKVMNWVGGVTDPKIAGTILATNGIPAILLKTSEGVYKYMRMEHVWVKAFVDYIPSRGAVHRQGDTWIPLDASYKQYAYSDGIDIKAAVPFDGQAFANQLQSTATINETEGYVTNVDSLFVQQTMQSYQTQVQNYIQQHYPNATVGDVIGKKEIVKKEYPILLGTLPFKTVEMGSEFASMPDSLRHKIAFEIQDTSTSETSLSYTIAVSAIIGKRVTLSYAPATAADAEKIDSYGGIFNVPAYLVKMKPLIKIEGEIAASGVGMGLGLDQVFKMKFVSPVYGVELITNNVMVGAYYGIGFNTGKISKELISQRRAKLESVKDTFSDLTIYTDDYLGELLYVTAIAYFYEVDLLQEVSAKTDEVIDIKETSAAIVSKELNVSYVFGFPLRASEGAMGIDVDRYIHAAFSKGGEGSKVRQFMMVAGQISSAMEHGIFEQMYQAKGVSTMQVLQLANRQEIPIYTITNDNISSVLPKVQISSEIKTDIQNAVNAGKNVVIPLRSVAYYSWSGTGYIVLDPQTGAGAYMLSTNLAHGGSCVASGGIAVVFLSLSAAAASSGATSSTSCNFAHIIHTIETPVFFLGMSMFTGGVAFALLYNAVTLGGVAGLLLGGIGLIVAIAAAIVIWFLIKALIDMYSHHAYNSLYERRLYGTGYNVKIV